MAEEIDHQLLTLDINKPIHVDGTTLEGGGQLLRIALALSSISGQAIHVTRIRGTRIARSKQFKRHKDRPKQRAEDQPPASTQREEGDAATNLVREGGGGLNPSLLAATQWLATATSAETTGMVAKSTDLTFRPTAIEAQDQQVSDRTWRVVYGKGTDGEQRVLRKESSVYLDSPGSTSLILQAVLPYLLFGGPMTSRNANDSTPPASLLRLSIRGGTNVTSSPSFEYMDQVLVPMLNSHLLRPGAVQVSLHRRGWCTGRKDIGNIQCDVVLQSPQAKLQAFHFQDRGDLKKFHVSILAPSAISAEKIRSEATQLLLQRWGEDVEIHFPVYEADTGHATRIYLLIVAETSNHYRLGRDALYQGPGPKKGAPGPDSDSLHKLVTKVVGELENELSHGGCVDEYMQDQLVIFQALAEDRSVVERTEQKGKADSASLHTQTARWVVREMLGYETLADGSFDIDGRSKHSSHGES